MQGHMLVEACEGVTCEEPPPLCKRRLSVQLSEASTVASEACDGEARDKLKPLDACDGHDCDEEERLHDAWPSDEAAAAWVRRRAGS